MILLLIVQRMFASVARANDSKDWVFQVGSQSCEMAQDCARMLRAYCAVRRAQTAMLAGIVRSHLARTDRRAGIVNQPL